VKEDQRGGACSTHGRGEICLKYFGWKNKKGSYNLEDLSVDGKIMLE
jgi:hypothetical protein